MSFVSKYLFGEGLDMGLIWVLRVVISAASVLVCLPALALQVGDRVKHTAGTVNVRNSASTSCSLLSTAARNGDLGVIVDGSESANGLT